MFSFVFVAGQTGKFSKELEALKLEADSIEWDGSKRRKYHYFTQGFLANEISYRADPRGRTLGQLLRKQLGEVGIDDVSIGIEPSDQDHLDRLVPLDFPDPWVLLKKFWLSKDDNFINALGVLKNLPHMIKG